MTRAPETLQLPLDSIERLVRERLVPAEAHVADRAERPSR